MSRALEEQRLKHDGERLLERLAVFFADELGDVAQDYLDSLDAARERRMT